MPIHRKGDNENYLEATSLDIAEAILEQLTRIANLLEAREKSDAGL